MQRATTAADRPPPPLSPAWVRRLRALRLFHPFPTLLNVVAVVALAFVAEDGAPSPWLVVRMIAVMLFAQAAIGAANDYYDRELDAMQKPWKPIPAGVVAPPTALWLAVGLTIAALAVATSIGSASLALAAAGAAAGLAYDVRLKRSRLSAVPYMVAIPVLPLWVWASTGNWSDVLWWLLPLGALIGLSLHLANTLPDLDADREAGVIGLAHWLGQTASIAIAWLSFGGALVVAAALALLIDYESAPMLLSLLVGAAALTAAVALYAWRRDDFALQFGFGALGIGAVAVATGWLAAAT